MCEECSLNHPLESVRLDEPASIVVNAVVVNVENVAVPKIGEHGPAVVCWDEEISDIERRWGP